MQRLFSNCRSRPDMKCIVFVNRIVVARSLTYILQNIAVLGYWKCDYLVGINSAQRSMSRKNMKIILEKFQSGKVFLPPFPCFEPSLSLCVTFSYVPVFSSPLMCWMLPNFFGHNFLLLRENLFLFSLLGLNIGGSCCRSFPCLLHGSKVFQAPIISCWPIYLPY